MKLIYAETQNQDIPTVDTDDFKLTKQNIYNEQETVLRNDFKVRKEVHEALTTLDVKTNIS